MADPVYDHNSIKVLSELEHLRSNRGMYIGSTENPNHLVYEVLDNSLDESAAKHANIVGVIIDQKNHTCIVSDNGRGIPYQNDTIKTISTKLFSGGKFTKGDEGSAYGIAAGLHGIGLVAVCALSDWMDIIVYRDGKKVYYRFEDAKVVKEEITEFDSAKRPFATQISFKPTKKYFESLIFDIDPIRKRMQLASVHIEHLQLILVEDQKKEIINCGLDDYFKDSLLDGNNQGATPLFHLRKKIKDEEIHLSFCWDLSSASTAKHTGCINLLPVSEGTHINMTNILFRDVFQKLCEKEKLKFQPNDCFVSFRCHTNLMLYKPNYTSQTKEKLSNSKAELDPLYADIDVQLNSLLEKNPEIKNTLLAFFDSYRKRLSANRNIIKGGINVNRYNQVIDSKLKDCTGRDVENSEMFIVEGPSAGGSATQCRDVRKHAILSLKGKIPNIAAAKKEFLKNKEICEIVNAVGTGIEPDFSLETARYGKIIMATDADADGAHISSLLMVVFLRLMPKLLQAGKIYRAIMPLYGTMVQKKFVPFYADAEMELFKKQNPNAKITRYKGLGEMNPDQLKVCLMDTTRKLEKIEFPADPQEIFKLMTDAELKRGLINED